MPSDRGVDATVTCLACIGTGHLRQEIAVNLSCITTHVAEGGGAKGTCIGKNQTAVPFNYAHLSLT